MFDRLARRWNELSRRLHWKLEPLLLRLPPFLSKPQSVFIKLTLRCNARCRHCDIWQHPTRPEDELSTDEWKDVLALLRRWLGPSYVFLTGGEALIRRDALELLEFAVGLGFRVEFLSNGYVLTDDIAREIMRIGPSVMAVSLDAPTAKLYDEFRGREGFFERANAALASLVKYKKEFNSPTTIIVKTVVMEPNLGELTKVVEHVRALGTAQIVFQPITQNYEQPMRLDWYTDPALNALWPKDAAKAAGVVDELIALAESGAPILNNRKSLDLMKAYFLEPAKWSRNMAYQIGDYHRSRCPSGIGGMEIGPSGDVRVCPMSDPIGNVRRRSPRTIWRRRPACWRKPCPWWPKM